MRLIANLIVIGSLCLIAWSDYTLYRKARTSEIIADSRAFSSDRVNQATTWMEVHWGDHLEPTPSSQGLSANQATFLIGIGILGLLGAVPFTGKPAIAQKAEESGSDKLPN